MFGRREQLNKHLRAGERSGCLWRGTQAIPSHLTPNWALITQTPLLRFVVVGPQWVWREALAVWGTALYLSLFLNAFYPTSNTVQSLCTFAFYFGSAPASLHRITSCFTSANASPYEAERSTAEAILRNGEKKKHFALLIMVVLFTGHLFQAEMIADVE